MAQRRLSQRGGYSQIRLARSRVRKLSYTALCIATKREYALNDEFQMTKNPTETFTLGHSPDPDDAFMFYAIAKTKSICAVIGLNIGWKIFRR